MNRYSIGIFVLFLVSHFTFAAEDWNIDGAHAAARFKIRHMTISDVEGTVGGIKGTFTWDEKDVTKTKAEATLDATTINTSNEERDKHLKSADFFDVEKFPTMTFKSKKAAKGGKGKFQIVGDFTVHGVTKEVTLDVHKLTDTLKDPWGGIRRGFLATTQLNRKDFGISWNKPLDKGGWVIGDTVDVTVEFELIAPKKEQKRT